MKTMNKKALVVAAVLPGIMVMSACKGDMTMKINEGGTAEMIMTFEDTTGELGAYMTCDDLAASADAEDMENGEITVRDISNGGNLACEMKAASYEDVVDGDTLIDNGDSYTFIMEGGEFGDATDMESLGMEFEFNMNVQMPGAITEATNGGQIDGNIARYTGTDWMSTGFEVTGGKTADGSAPSGGGTETDGNGDNENNDGTETDGTGGTETDGTNDETNDAEGVTVNPDGDNADQATDSDDEGFPMWAWFAIGGGLLLLIAAGVIAAMMNKKKKDQQAHAYGYGQNPYAQGGQNPYAQGGQPGQYQGQYGTNSYGQPTNPQYGAGHNGQPQAGQQQPTQQFGTNSYGQPTNPQYGAGHNGQAQDGQWNGQQGGQNTAQWDQGQQNNGEWNNGNNGQNGQNS